MAFKGVDSGNAACISTSEQHAFLDLAKAFKWEEVKQQVSSYPNLVNVQPCGREGMPRWSALHQAAHDGNADAVQFLLRSGASVDAKTNDGKIPVDVAKSEQVRSILLTFSNAFTPSMPTPFMKFSAVLKAGGGKPKAKAATAMKASKIKKVKTRKIARGKQAKALVYKGKFTRTVSGLTKDHLTKNRNGKVVSKKMQARGMKSYDNIKRWVQSFLEARSALGLTSFVALSKDSALYNKTMEIYKS
jgi:hypothetical protein